MFLGLKGVCIVEDDVCRLRGGDEVMGSLTRSSAFYIERQVFR